MYKNNATLKAHHASNIHLTWEYPIRIKTLEIQIKRNENDMAHDKRLIILLTDQLHTELEKKMLIINK
jgi:hypothetical protein